MALVSRTESHGAAPRWVLRVAPLAYAVVVSNTTIAVGSDHAGFHLKNVVAEHLRGRGVEVMDLGTDSEERVDYPDFGEAVGRAVGEGGADLGVAVCGSGIGICMAADKVPGVRAGTVHDETSARLARQHNDANVICLGARLVGESVALAAVDAWLDATFEGGRHTARVAKLDSLLPVE
ncbi:MAG: ribose 5-phosphate isomerase B [Microthrixaceae bacterium]|nr:ribose 5-phosphate isomerase B [Microthrixaceae bacterium]